MATLYNMGDRVRFKRTLFDHPETGRVVGRVPTLKLHDVETDDGERLINVTIIELAEETGNVA